MRANWRLNQGRLASSSSDGMIEGKGKGKLEIGWRTENGRGVGRWWVGGGVGGEETGRMRMGGRGIHKRNSFEVATWLSSGVWLS